MSDIHLHDEGSIFLLRPVSAAGTAWLEQHLFDAIGWGTAFVVEHRYVAPIVTAAIADGLVIEAAP